MESNETLFGVVFITANGFVDQVEKILRFLTQLGKKVVGHNFEILITCQIVFQVSLNWNGDENPEK